MRTIFSKLPLILGVAAGVTFGSILGRGWSEVSLVQVLQAFLIGGLVPTVIFMLQVLWQKLLGK